MYVGPWQEYHLAGGKLPPQKSTSKDKKASNISLDEMRRALLLSLDADTTRRALAALEAANIVESESEVIRRKPLIRLTDTKLPPLKLDYNASETRSSHFKDFSVDSPYTYGSSTESKQLSSRSPLSNTRSSLYSDRSTVSEPAKPSQSAMQSFHRSKYASIHRSDESSTIISSSISKSYDSTAVVGILRADRTRENKFKKFFGAFTQSKQGPISTEAVASNSNKVLELDKKVAGVKKMQDVYTSGSQEVVHKQDLLVEYGDQGLRPHANRMLNIGTKSVAATPPVGDMDITDDELAVISKYFGGGCSEIYHDTNVFVGGKVPQAAVSSYQEHEERCGHDDLISFEGENNEDGLLQWFNSLKPSDSSHLL
jgi:hypothetical protein